MPSKIHFDFLGNGESVCGRGSRTHQSVTQVTCGFCLKHQDFIAAKAMAEAKAHLAFLATEPRKFREPWKDGAMTCSECGGHFFRMGNRTCHGHYQNYHCANCDHVESRLTETGMSF